ncbi:MAG: peptidase MA family metallohydrolase [bacterium]
MMKSDPNYKGKKRFAFFGVLIFLFIIQTLISVISCNLLFSHEFPTDWETQETAHFVLHFQQKDHLLADYIMESAEEDYKRIIHHIGIDPGIKAMVYIAPDRDSYQALQPKGKKTHEWSIGVFYPHQNLILLLSPKAQKETHPDLQQIMAHELTHFILYTVTREKGIDLPIWLHEGLAMYEAKQWNWNYRRIMAETALTRSFLPLSSITNGFPSEKRLADRAYAQSISLIAYIINKYGVDYLNKLIQKLVEGSQTPEAFFRVFGITLEDFENNWHMYLRRRYNWIPFLTSGFAIWFLISLLFLGIYVYKRRLAKKRIALWDIEDQIDSL